MKTFIIEDVEKERIKFLYESKGIILYEDFWGPVARIVRKFVGQSEDDIARALKTTEIGLVKSLDDVVLPAIKSKNSVPLDDLQEKMMHFFNPGGTAEGVAAAQANVKNTLNAYAKSKGKLNWKAFKDEISGTPQQEPNFKGQNATDDYAQVLQNPIGAIKGNYFSGHRISNRTLDSIISKIDSSKIKNWGGSVDSYNKLIANAIKTGDYRYVSSGGFESLGITNFREFLKNNISKVNEVDPNIGRWSVNFK